MHHVIRIKQMSVCIRCSCCAFMIWNIWTDITVTLAHNQAKILIYMLDLSGKPLIMESTFHITGITNVKLVSSWFLKNHYLLRHHFSQMLSSPMVETHAFVNASRWWLDLEPPVLLPKPFFSNPHTSVQCNMLSTISDQDRYFPNRFMLTWLDIWVYTLKKNTSHRRLLTIRFNELWISKQVVSTLIVFIKYLIQTFNCNRMAQMNS